LPTIREGFLSSVVYLYKNEDDAANGERTGGSGFIAGVWNPFLGAVHLYVVTNRHVIREGFSVVRLTSSARPTVIEPAPAVDWVFPDGPDDLAVWHYKVQDPTFDQEFAYVSISDYATTTAQLEGPDRYGPGDECFMVGRFITHDGTQRNLPSVRFGNIAMMPLEPFRHHGAEVDAFMVETRSQAGYSGSPVFVFRKTVDVQIPIRDVSAYKASVREITVTGREEYEIKLLGVDFAHLPNKVSIQSDDPIAQGMLENAKVEVGSGMLAVAPAWKLIALLNTDQAKEVRARMASKHK
jgi:hypothetical protein